MIKRLELACLLLILPSLGWANTSRENRTESLLYLGVSPIGLHVPTLLTHPVGAGVFLGPDWLIGAEYGSFSATFEDDQAEATADYRNIGVYGRWFMGTNSFNLGLAVHRRDFSAAATSTVDDPQFGEVKVKGTLDTEATVGSILLGNQWMMDFGLVIGLDWIVVSGLISGTSSSSINGTATLSDGSIVDVDQLDPETKQRAEDDLSELGEVVNQVSAFPGALVLTIGWAF